MAGTCIACLSTQNLIKMGQKEWIVFDMLLHPIIKKYKSILRSDQRAKICANCRRSMRYVEKFRRSSFKNLLLLMNRWNEDKSSFKDSSKSLPDDPLNDEPDTKPDKYGFMPTISPTSSDYEEDDTHEIIKEESLSDTEEENTEIIIVTDPIESTEPNCYIIEGANAVDKIAEIQASSEDETVAFSRIYTEKTRAKQKIEIQRATLPKPKRMPRPHKEPKSPKGTPKLRRELPKLRKERPISRKEKTIPSKEMGYQKHSCEVCDKIFKTSGELANHGNRHHGRSSPVNCPQCDKTVNNRYSLYRHTRYVHLKKKSKSETELKYCDVCNKYYKHVSSFKKHFKQLTHLSAEILKKDTSSKSIVAN